MDPVAEHDRAVEREARLRAVPGDELADGVMAISLRSHLDSTVLFGVLSARTTELPDS